MVTTNEPHACILIDVLLGVRYIETDIHIHTACLDFHWIVTIKYLTRFCVYWNILPSYRRYFESMVSLSGLDLGHNDYHNVSYD